MTTILDDITDALQRLDETRRLILCHPTRHDLVLAALQDAGLHHHHKIRVNPACPTDRVFVIDPRALEIPPSP